MPAALQIGPLALPLTALLLLLCVLIGSGLSGRLGRRAGVRVDKAQLVLLAVALIVARLAFVWNYRHAYTAAPLDVLDLRDGGWNAQAGLLGAWLAALVLVRRRPALRNPLLAGLVAASALWITGSVALLLAGPRDTGLPQIEVSHLDGTVTSLSEYAGQPLVINLWATWCPPCRRELPVLARAQAEHPSVQFVFLNQGEAPAAVQKYLASSGLALRDVLLDRKGQAGAPHGGMLPTTLFFDARARLVGVRVGELSSGSLQRWLDELQQPDR